MNRERKQKARVGEIREGMIGGRDGVVQQIAAGLRLTYLDVDDDASCMLEREAVRRMGKKGRWRVHEERYEGA